MNLKISEGNIKMGAIPSLSLPPVITCREGAPCCRDCYACRLCRRRQNVADSYQSNLDFYRRDPDGFFRELTAVLILNAWFRVHVGGDIPDADYFPRLVKACRKARNCHVLLFTKRFEIVNDFIADGGKLPRNLRVVFSNWGDEFRCENPHNLPVSEVIFRGEEPKDGWKTCPGNCAECCCRGTGCWTLKNGETIAFYKH